MKFLANMGISLATVEFLRNLGHEAVHLHEEASIDCQILTFCARAG